MTKDIALNDLPLESIKVQLLDSFEEVSDTLQVIDKNWKRLERFGKLLIAAKTKVPHGEWEDWLVDTFQGRLQLRTAQRWISDAKFPAKAEARREKDREAKASKATDLSLLESEESKGSVEVLDPDPTPDPPTQRKTAKGSEKVPEAAKPRTQQVPVEIIEADEPAAPFEVDPWEFMTFGDIIAVAVSKLSDDQKKKAAKELRKHADQLDPPDETKAAKIPTITELKALIDKTELSDQMLTAVTDWVQYKQKHPDKKYRYQSGESFTRDQKRMEKVYMQTGEPFVLEAIDTAIAKGWRGWEQDSTSNGKGNGNGHSTTATRNGGNRGLTAEDVFSAESLGRSRKRN